MSPDGELVAWIGGLLLDLPNNSKATKQRWPLAA